MQQLIQGILFHHLVGDGELLFHTIGRWVCLITLFVVYIISLLYGLILQKRETMLMSLTYHIFN
jgi:hypothetical protein